MRLLQLLPHLTTSELSVKLSSCGYAYQRSYWQILLSVSFNPNKKAEEYASFLGLSKSKIYKVVQLYNKKGASFVDNVHWGGRRTQTSHLSFEEEKQMMDELKNEAIKGKILVAKHLREIVEQKIGKKVSDDYLWDLLKRHGWKKKMPRPEHPKRHKSAQEDFKKNSPNCWLPTV